MLDPLFTKHFNDREMEDAERFLSWLCEKRLFVERSYTLRWDGDKEWYFLC